MTKVSFIICLYSLLYKKYRGTSRFTLVQVDFDDEVLLSSAVELLQYDTECTETSWGSSLNIMIPQCIWEKIYE